MAQLTITEALAELKVLDKRITKKREFVASFLARQDMLKDPHEKDGGSAEVLKRELQGVADLETRIVAIRHAINDANLSTPIVVAGVSRPVGDWIIWKREVAPRRQAFLTEIANRLETLRKTAAQKNVGVVQAGSPTAAPSDIIVNINEKDLAREREDLDAALETLDGQLSLKNATTFIDA